METHEVSTADAANTELERFKAMVNARDDRLAVTLNALLEGNYEVVIDDDSQLGQTLSMLVERLRSLATQDLDRVVDLSVCSSETTISAARLFHNLQKTNDRAQSIAAAAEQMQASAEQIRTYSDEINQENMDSVTIVERVRDDAQESVEIFQRINKSVTESAGQISELKAFATDVINIANDIRGIAFQTKILAMNAAVEAARAGAAGAGFGVVAQEMRTLSDRSADATKKINELAREFDEQMTDVSEVLSQTVNFVQQGHTATTHVGDRIHDMSNNIAKVANSIDHITNSIQEQTAAATDVTMGITDIADSTSTSVHNTDVVVEAMNELQSFVDDHIVQIAALELPSKIVKLAQSDHVIWKKRLVNMLAGREGLKSSELADHHSCRLGKWYDAVTDKSLLGKAEFKELAGPHEQVHTHGKHAVDLFNQGKVSAALDEFSKVEAASEEVLRLLRAME